MCIRYVAICSLGDGINCIGLIHGLIRSFDVQLAAEAASNVVFLDLDYLGEAASGSFRVGYQGAPMLQAGFTQAITPELVVGAQGAMQPSKGIMSQAFAGRYETDDYSITGVLDGPTVRCARFCSGLLGCCVLCYWLYYHATVRFLSYTGCQLHSVSPLVSLPIALVVIE